MEREKLYREAVEKWVVYPEAQPCDQPDALLMYLLQMLPKFAWDPHANK